jgi:hypothetical protein
MENKSWSEGQFQSKNKMIIPEFHELDVSISIPREYLFQGAVPAPLTSLISLGLAGFKRRVVGPGNKVF